MSDKTKEDPFHGELREISNRIVDWLEGSTIAPYHVELSPTDRCGLKCLPCFARGKPIGKKSEELSENNYLEIVKEGSDMGVRKWVITGGGEPMSRPELTTSLVKKIKQRGGRGVLSTSGAFFERKDLEILVEEGWDMIQISIDGPNAKIDDFIRGENVFLKTIRNLKLLRRIKRNKMTKKPRVELRPVLTSKNYDRITDFVELGKILDTDYIVLQPFMSELLPGERLGSKKERREVRDQLKLDERQKGELKDEIERACDLAKKYESLGHNFHEIRDEFFNSDKDCLEEEDKTEEDKEETQFSSISCYYPWHTLQIDSDGTVSPCAEITSSKNVKEETLEEIWRSKEFRKLRKTLSEGKLPEGCKYCCPVLKGFNNRLREFFEEIAGVPSK